MPLQTETIDLNAEIQRLQSEMEELATQVSGMDDSTPEELAARTIQEGRSLETHINFLKTLTQGEAAGLPKMEEVTFAGLTAGEIDLVDDIDSKHENMRRNKAWVAVATRGDAPYLEHDPEEPLTVDAVEETALKVADLPRPYVSWAESKIGDLSHLGEDRGNGFLALASEKARNQGEG